MNHFVYKNDDLFCEDVPIRDIVDKVGTPFYCYSHATITRHFRAFQDAFKDLDHLTCFSVKSSSNLAILKIIALHGGGADIVSGGELFRALKAGIAPDKIVYSGVGKTPEEMKFALTSNICMFNVESKQELQALDTIAGAMGRKATVALRINPEVKPHTHPYIVTGHSENKFGISLDDALPTYESARHLKNIDVKGVSCHIGSQLTDIDPFLDAVIKLKDILQELKKMAFDIQFLNLGGGLGITYNDEKPPHPLEYAMALKKLLRNNDITLILEPGRVIIGNAGILITRALYTKSTKNKRFVIVDAGMNDLIRPTLYNSFHAIQPVKIIQSEMVVTDLVGPVCETGDFFAKNRKMPAFQSGDLIAIMSAGAYGFSMASNYNSRPRPAEVMVKGNLFSIIRSQETYDDLIHGEMIPKFL
ncbi:MAG: diaminopimelate decarboxylase [Deltaproteobacteria bacterium]|nr:diaminopimelate decarboxylase [Deltaproteobacteria bacterium]